MKVNMKLSMAIAAALGAGYAAQASALDLYVDEHTHQIYSEPGYGRTKLGEFERVSDAKSAPVAVSKAETSAKAEEGLGKLHVDEKGIKFESADGNFEMSINGRMQVDSQAQLGNQNDVATATSGNVTNNLADGTSIRRARLGVEGSFYKDYEYKFEYDFTRGNGTTAGGVTDAYVAWKGYDPLNLKVGQFKEPFSLEEATSNRWVTFIERNMAVNTFSDNNNAYKIGAAIGWSQPRWTATGAIQTESVGNGGPTNDGTSLNGNVNANRNNGSGDTGWALTARVTGLPWFQDKTHFAHVGVAGSERWLNNNYKGDGSFSNGGMTFASALNTNVDRTLILNTGNLTSGNLGAVNSRQVSSVTRFGGETAVVYGPFSAQAEYIQANIDGTGYGKETLDGAYGFVSYFVTGESRNYKAKTGAWDRIKPNHNFSTRGGWGAWELAAGYDYLNLNSGIIQGGRASTGKFGVNWYPNSHVKLMANYVHFLDVDTQDVTNYNAAGVGSANARSVAFDKSNLDVVEVRAQVDF